MLSFIVNAIPYAFMVGLAFAFALMFLLQYRLVARISPVARLITLVVFVGAGALLSVALTNRTLDETAIAAGLGSTYDDVASGFSASRWLSLMLVGASMIELVRGYLHAARLHQVDPARPLLWALLAYFLGTSLIQAVASDQPGFSLRDLYVPTLLVAVYFQRPSTLCPIVEASKWIVFALTAGSLASIWLRPDFVMHRPDPSWLPGVQWRLYGLAPHANALGPMALLGLLLELHMPSRWRVLRLLHLSAATVVLVLAQSKTTWSTVPLLLIMVPLPLAVRRGMQAAGASGSFGHTVVALLAAIAMCVVVASALVAFDVFDLISHRTDLITLTGRTEIWDITLRAWKQNPMFGYGPGIWGEERRLLFHMFYVGHAHNQIVQTLGEAGIAGLLVLLFYLGTLLAIALRRFVASRGMVLMLLILVLVRCVTEAPLRGEGLLSWATFVHMLLLVFACYHIRRPQTSAADAALVPVSASTQSSSALWRPMYRHAQGAQ